MPDETATRPCLFPSYVKNQASCPFFIPLFGCFSTPLRVFQDLRGSDADITLLVEPMVSRFIPSFLCGTIANPIMTRTQQTPINGGNELNWDQNAWFQVLIAFIAFANDTEVSSDFQQLVACAWKKQQDRHVFVQSPCPSLPHWNPLTMLILA